jgi:hypothetical protein
LIEIITYLIEVEFYTEDIYLKEYRYLISTPADSYYPYAFGSIGKSIYKPDAHAAVFYVTAGSLDDDTASLAEFYKSYPHDYPPSYSEAYYLWIYEYIVAVVYISQYPPAQAAYTEFGVDIYGRLTYAGKSYWALCPAPDCPETYLVYWIGSGSAPYGCITDVTLRLRPYGLPSIKSYYHRKGGNGGYIPPIYTPPSYAYPSTPSDPGYTTPPYYQPDPTTPYYYQSPTPVDPYYSDPGQSYPTYPSSPYYQSPTPVDPYSSSPYYYSSPTPVDPYYSDPGQTYPTVYPIYTSVVGGQPTTVYDTTTAYYTSDAFAEDLMGRPTLK